MSGVSRGATAAGPAASQRAGATRQSILLPGASAFRAPSSAPFRSAGNAPGTAGAAAGRAGASASSRPTSPESAASKPSKARAGVVGESRARQDNILVTSLIVAFLLVTVGFGSVRMRGTMSRDRSKAAIAATLVKVHQQQSTFRTINQRFATWRELEDSGVKLGPKQVVEASNATSYHWYLSVRDSSTGVTCSQTGELFDSRGGDRRAACIDQGGL